MKSETEGKAGTEVLDGLAATIKARSGATPDHSWTATLLARGLPYCARKLGEEAVETIIAATTQDKAALVRESADLIYHWLVLLRAAGVEPGEVYAELARREGRSGLEEKASRSA